jgi:hypothetical protein
MDTAAAIDVPKAIRDAAQASHSVTSPHAAEKTRTA